MKALVLHQPWASLVASGAKRYETRSWRTSHRGPLAICAAASFPREARALVNDDPFRWSLLAATLCREEDLRDRPEVVLPLGAIIAMSWVEDCVPADQADVDDDERAFGNYAAGRWAWKLREPIQIAPVAVRGFQRVFNVPDELVPENVRNAIQHPGVG